jgi:hypothetical protein
MWTKSLHAGKPASGKWGARVISRASRDQRPASDVGCCRYPHILADTFVGPFGYASLTSLNAIAGASCLGGRGVLPFRRAAGVLVAAAAVARTGHRIPVVA